MCDIVKKKKKKLNLSYSGKSNILNEHNSIFVKCHLIKIEVRNISNAETESFRFNPQEENQVCNRIN